mmetsp:Transcript_107282/g.268966  ORF Transcript_107282/g.268966 Transcript_107282/m.268966 type:complete len:272 (+) Transcript_107282:275-1090(+)
MRVIVCLDPVLALCQYEVRVAIDLSAVSAHAKVEGVLLVVVLHVLIRGQVLQRYDRVVDGQEQHCHDEEDTIHEQANQYGILGADKRPIEEVCLVPILGGSALIKDAESHEDAQNEKHRRAVDQAHKVPIVVQPHAIPKPSAMVVEPEHAIVAELAMLRARGPEDVAGLAKFLFHGDAVDTEEAVQGLALNVEAFSFELLRHSLIARHNAWVDERCQGEGYHDGHAQNALKHSKETAHDQSRRIEDLREHKLEVAHAWHKGHRDRGDRVWP